MYWLLVLLLSGGSNTENPAKISPLLLKYNKENMVEIRGAIDELTNENWYLQGKVNLVAKITTPDGKTRLVDLGPKHLYKKIPKQNQIISARGSEVEYNGKTYLLSTKISLSVGKWIEIRDKKGVPIWFEKGKNSKFHYRMNRMRRMRKMR